MENVVAFNTEVSSVVNLFQLNSSCKLNFVYYINKIILQKKKKKLRRLWSFKKEKKNRPRL